MTKITPADVNESVNSINDMELLDQPRNCQLVEEVSSTVEVKVIRIIA
jgi:hypothetical protein